MTDHPLMTTAKVDGPSAIQYPHTWYEVTPYSRRPEPTEMVRETAAKLFYMLKPLRGGVPEELSKLKATSGSEWFSTLEAAEARIAEYRAAEKRRQDAKRLRDAAPYLLEAAQELLSHRVGDLPIRGWLRDNDASRAALAKLAAALTRALAQEGK